MRNAARPKVLFVGHTAYDLPLDPQAARKWDALSETLDPRVIGPGGRSNGSDGRFRPLRLDGPLSGPRFYAGLPLAVRREVSGFEADAVIAQSPYEAAMIRLAWPLGRPPVPVIAEVHGDWRTASRLYGSPRRRLASPVTDRVAVAGLRSAAGVRTVGPRMSELSREVTGRAPDAVFPTWFDSARFFDAPPKPLPERPVALWVGVLERYKDPDTLAAAWRNVASRLTARLVVVGRGRMRHAIEALLREFPDRVLHLERLDSEGISRALDEAWTLVLPSRSEGLPRVGIEALARGRPIVGTAVDGITDLVQDHVNGRLVPSGDALALADALCDVLGDRQLAAELGRSGRMTAERFRRSPEEYAAQVRALVDSVVSEWRRDVDRITSRAGSRR
jgi:glycosyltransferase involved in cell wall biosynthesis